MNLVYKINWFAEKISRALRLTAGIAAALIIVFLFVENNEHTTVAQSDSRITQAIQRSVDLTSKHFKNFIQTINPIK